MAKNVTKQRGSVGLFVFACWFFFVGFGGFATLAVLRGQYGGNRGHTTHFADEPGTFVFVVGFMFLFAALFGSLAGYMSWKLLTQRGKDRSA
ncbi:MAG: hypothetical protein RIM84_26550 [Alphaproteobacteria bacterium]